MKPNMFSAQTCKSLLLAAVWIVLLTNAAPVSASKETAQVVHDDSASKGHLPNGATHLSSGGEAACFSSTLEVSVTATNVAINYPEPVNQTVVTKFLLDFSTRGSTVVQGYVTGPNVIEQTYSVYVELCIPLQALHAGKSVNIVHLLSAGATIDHTYWDIAPGNSYVDAAAKEGYATLSHDRVGCGLSQHPDPIQVVQSGVHVEVVHALAEQLRKSGIQGYTFDHVVAVGHSLGSWYNHAAAAKYLDDFDAVVMTGVSTYSGSAVTSFAASAFQIANTEPVGRFQGLANGYLAAVNAISTLQFTFHYFPYYTNEVLELEWEARQTFSIGELVTPFLPMVVSNYSKPVDVMSGQHDFVTCGGDCTYEGVDVVAQVLPVFLPKASKGSQSYLVPNSGHNINAHVTANLAFQQIFSFLAANGLSVPSM